MWLAIESLMDDIQQCGRALNLVDDDPCVGRGAVDRIMEPLWSRQQGSRDSTRAKIDCKRIGKQLPRVCRLPGSARTEEEGAACGRRKESAKRGKGCNEGRHPIL